ncbi:hypothetical protein [Nocardia arthritidis]|uniref:Uncharacterized protein n=1 Tax=Nocardia arthritidis TaxID=228602 RepID=A0A6G9YLY7_9NOCA|nr:hypothetical protein [Nocardia arthritidis]QIS14224.1 hypothetical protein F5544_31925 [Nocardia arthritidis]
MTIDQDELQRILLARLSGDADAGAGLNLPELVQQAVGDDPVAAQVISALRQRQAMEQAQLSEPQVVEQSDPVVADVLERLYDEVEVLRRRNRALADALGACPRCWGDAADCPRCRGRGRPGGRFPDPTLFAEFIEPAVRRRFPRAISDRPRIDTTTAQSSPKPFAQQ